MKFSMMTAVAAVAIAAMTGGCKYDKAAKGAGDGAGADGEGSISTITATDADSEAEGGSIADLGQGRFEDLYTKCTDVEFAPVYFGFDSTVVPQGELGKIEAVAMHLKDNADRVVVVEGNCDERGSNEYNVSLGEQRAIIVRNYLVENGIDSARIQTRSYGEEKPAVDGHDEGAWAKNRRGEFGVYKK